MENSRKKIAIVGSGFSGSVIANQLAKVGCQVDVYEKRTHVGGNCYTEVDKKSNILLHTYGPHIFHTDDESVWNYVNEYLEMEPFVNRVKANYGGKVFSLPVNLHTINQLYGTSFSPKEAEEFIASEAESIDSIISFEDQALSFLGRKIYQAFFYGYTKKQWGVEPRELPASILKRLPVRFNYDDNYFNHKYQGIPKNGYTPMFEKLLSHENISVLCNRVIKREELNELGYDHVFWSGPIDEYFGRCLGSLSYRTLHFERMDYEDIEDFQGNAVINYTDPSVQFTRITEHKHFAPKREVNGTIVYKEFSKEWSQGDIEYYPKRLASDKDLLSKYQSMATQESTTTFIGRLGTYRYLDMDVTIKEALEVSSEFIKTLK